MNLLLDTYVLLWWLDDHPNLSYRAKAAIADGKNLILVSAADHAHAVGDLEPHHRDPFDRMLVAQAKVEGADPVY